MIYGFQRISDIFGIAVEAFLVYTLLATKSFKQENMKVYDARKSQDMDTNEWQN